MADRICAVELEWVSPPGGDLAGDGERVPVLSELAVAVDCVTDEVTIGGADDSVVTEVSGGRMDEVDAEVFGKAADEGGTGIGVVAGDAGGTTNTGSEAAGGSTEAAAAEGGGESAEDDVLPHGFVREDSTAVPCGRTGVACIGWSCGSETDEWPSAELPSGALTVSVVAPPCFALTTWNTCSR